MLLSTLVATAIAAQGILASPTANKGDPAATLNGKLVSYGKQFWGSIVDTFGGHSINAPEHSAIVVAQFGAVTAEDATTWGATEPTRGQFSFTRSDAVIAWAIANGKLFRGHSLVWHSQAPGWLFRINDAYTLKAIIKEHIEQVAGRYKGKVWDVVTDAISDAGGLRSTPFSQLLGESFIPFAFQTARAVDPDAKLYISDYNLQEPTKLASMVELVTRLNTENPGLIDGIGTQAHLSALQAPGTEDALAALAAAGTEISITELDIAGGSVEDYVSVVSACIKTPACVSITSWGVSDKDSWRSSVTPLLWDDQFQAKPAYDAILSLPNTL